MKVSKRVLADLEKVYSLALIPSKMPDLPPGLAAGSEGDAELFLLEPPSYSPKVIASQPGGFMSLCSFQEKGRQYLLASTNFKPGFKGEDCRLVLYDLDQRKSTAPHEVAILPFSHRIAVTKVAGQLCFLASTLCSRKDYKDDWSHPGGIHLGIIPDPLAQRWGSQLIISGLNKNHGFEATCLRRDTVGGFLICAMEGLFYAAIPSRLDVPWEIEVVSDHEHSDAFAFDWDGSGLPQIFAISPFHGDTLSVYCRTREKWHRKIIDEDIEAGHVLWAGRLLGQAALIVGGRAGRKALAIYRLPSSSGSEISKEIIDEGIGPTQMLVIDRRDEAASLIVAAHAVNKVLLYQIE